MGLGGLHAATPYSLRSQSEAVRVGLAPPFWQASPQRDGPVIEGLISAALPIGYLECFQIANRITHREGRLARASRDAVVRRASADRKTNGGVLEIAKGGSGARVKSGNRATVRFLTRNIGSDGRLNVLEERLDSSRESPR